MLKKTSVFNPTPPSFLSSPPQIIEALWPYIKQMSNDIVTQAVRDNLSKLPAFITDLNVEVDLGTHGPLINGLRAYDSELTQDEVLLDLDVAFGGDFFAQIKVQLH